VVFLRINRYVPDVTDDEAFALTMSVAAGQLDADAIQNQLRHHLRCGAVIGSGAEEFAAAANALFSWQAHLRAGRRAASRRRSDVHPHRVCPAASIRSAPRAAGSTIAGRSAARLAAVISGG
jgi:hypothetical protein